MSSKPTGLVTFLLTDIESSTMLSQDYPETLQTILERHQSIMRNAVESNNGFVFEVVGENPTKQDVCPNTLIPNLFRNLTLKFYLYSDPKTVPFQNLIDQKG
jgi:hypothetical protein